MYVSACWILNSSSSSNSTRICPVLLDSSNKLILFHMPPDSSTPNLCLSHLCTHTQNHSSTLPLFRRIPETWFVTSVRNTLDATEGRCSTWAEASSRNPPHFQTSNLDFWRTQVAWATHNRCILTTPNNTQPMSRKCLPGFGTISSMPKLTSVSSIVTRVNIWDICCLPTASKWTRTKFRPSRTGPNPQKSGI